MTQEFENSEIVEKKTLSLETEKKPLKVFKYIEVRFRKYKYPTDPKSLQKLIEIKTNTRSIKTLKQRL